MSCQLHWNFNEYKENVSDGEVSVVVLTAPVNLTGIENNTLKELKGHLVLDITRTEMGEVDDFQENYNIIFSVDNKVIGSLYVVTGYQQPQSDKFQTLLNNITGTVSCKGLFSDFNNGTAIIEFDNKTGKRCLSLYENNSKITSNPQPSPEPLPQLAGDWTYGGSILRRRNTNEKPDFDNIITIPPTSVKITQKERYIILEVPTDITRPTPGFLLGNLTYVVNHWKLTFSDYDDNGIFSLNEIGKGVWEGAYQESGFCGSREQFQTAGIIRLEKR